MPRPLGLEYEVVLHIDTGGETWSFTEDTMINVVMAPFLMHHTDQGWMVAGFETETPPKPGWPPSA